MLKKGLAIAWDEGLLMISLGVGLRPLTQPTNLYYLILILLVKNQ